MPATTRYSATFDRPYEEDDHPEPLAPPLQRRSRSMSLQTTPRLVNGSAYAGLGSAGSSQRSSSQDNGLEQIPTRTAGKAAVKAHSNPFQFVKVGTCSLYKKAEDQLKQVKEVKKPEVLKEEEEEWQSNLDSWKSRRRKMSEDVFKRQEEIRQFEIEDQLNQEKATPKKTKTFSEMIESRATRGRALSLCLISSPLELQDWEPGNRSSKKMNSMDNLLSGESESEKNSVTSEDEAGGYEKQEQNNIKNGNGVAKSNGAIYQNGGSRNSDNNYNKLCEAEVKENTVNTKDDHSSCGIFTDSGIESISSHRAGEIPDSGSDFSQDSAGSMDSDSPMVADAKLLQGFSPQSDQEKSSGSLHNGVTSNGHVMTNGGSVSKTNENERTLKIVNDKMPKTFETKNSKSAKDSEKNKIQERSIESENEMYVDDFEELNGKIPASSSTKTLSSAKKEPAVTKDNKVPQTSSDTKNSIDFETSSSSVINSKTSTDSPPADIEEKLKGSDSKQKIANGTCKAAQKKPKNSSKPSDKKPVNNPKSLNEVLIETSTAFTSNGSSLNVIYQSRTEVKTKVAVSQSTSSEPKASTASKPSVSVPSVEKVAEEMEKLILEQLEEEEKAKEIAFEARAKENICAMENGLSDSVRQLTPPNEKPPPPPPAEISETKKAPSLNRQSSTKRIKKEIHKRRSNFLGIENEDENIICDDSSIPPPPALQDILKAEMEIDREGRKQVESAALERLSIEESEIIRKEREIIENIEMEERRKIYMGITEKPESCNSEEERIQNLKEERKKVGEEHALSDEQKIRLEEERYLQEREEYIRKQEDANTAELSTPLISTATTSTTKAPALPNSPSSTNSNTLLSEKGGGENTISDSLTDKTTVVQEKPIVPPKPLKKKELIRKERERLRQEQEALQREREEHRQKLLLEQELVKKGHAPEAPVTRVGPPLPVKPTLNSQLTPPSALPMARENAAHSSRSPHGAQNGVAGNSNPDAKHLRSTKQSKSASSRNKVMQNDSWGQQKVPSARKQNDSLNESRYNQNHWLIQEAEMRRIAEYNERQHSQTASHPGPYTPAPLVEEDICGNIKANQRPQTAVPVNYIMSPQAAPHDQMWNYGHANGQVVKYPPPLTGEKAHLHASYPRKTVDPPTKPSRVVSVERPEQMLSVSGRKKCSHCSEELGRGAAMIIESLQLYYHIQCFQCCVCHAQLGNGSCGTDVRVRNNKLHCHNCYSNDEAGLKFSQV